MALRKAEANWVRCMLPLLPQGPTKFPELSGSCSVASGRLTGLKRERQESGTCQNGSAEMRMEGDSQKKGGTDGGSLMSVHDCLQNLK